RCRGNSALRNRGAGRFPQGPVSGTLPSPPHKCARVPPEAGNQKRGVAPLFGDFLRTMNNQYVPLFVAPTMQDEPALWLGVRRAEIVVVNGAAVPELPCCRDLAEHGLQTRRSQYLGLYGGKHAYAAEIAEEHVLPEGWATLGLRDLFGLVETTV